MNNLDRPYTPQNSEYRFDSFSKDSVLLNKKKGHLPAMGWNSWNAFGSGNTEELSKVMADRLIELGLDKLGYQYIVLDDGCYKPVRIDGRVSNEEIKFPSGFRALSDYIHSKGLKFGMYNDVGTNLCAGAEVGTCLHEDVDAQKYVEWGVDFIKVDNCYYPWDNATFSNEANARFVYAPNIKSVRVEGDSFKEEYKAVNGLLYGKGAECKDDHVTGIGTLDGTGPEHSPLGALSSELRFNINVPRSGEYDVYVTYATAEVPGIGCWLQLATGTGDDTVYFYDDPLKATQDSLTFTESEAIKVSFKEGDNLLRLMNHRRQENTLCSYAKLLEAFNKADPDHDVILSICEWGKTQPHIWGRKVGDSWRTLNDITFWVGSDGDPGKAKWQDDYTPSITSQYNKAVIMDEFAGLDKGWNDPDMLTIGMNDLSLDMCKTHMIMWCMMNAPLMLGLDLRRVQKGDELYKIIANKGFIDLNQDALGIQAKRVYCSLAENEPDKEYIRDINRLDILAKPLSDNSAAVSFINVSNEHKSTVTSIDAKTIVKYIGDKMPDKAAFLNAEQYKVIDLWTGNESINSTGKFETASLDPADSVCIKVIPI